MQMPIDPGRGGGAGAVALESAGPHGATLVATDREGEILPDPDVKERLRPGDPLILLGTTDQILATREMVRGRGRLGA